MEYKENIKFKNIAVNMLSEIENFCELNDKFNICIDTIAQAVINPLKVSYIKKDKIQNLLEHAGIVIADKPTPEQREKYFNCCSLQKFANSFFNKEGLTQEQLQEFNDIVQKATKEANTTLKKEFHILDKEFIPRIYNMPNNKSEAKIVVKDKEFSVSIDGSCMQGKPEHYFSMYKDINTDLNDIKIAILTQGTEIIARALVWLNAPESEIDRRKKQKPRTFYIDRIYTKTQQHRTETQKALYLNILKYYNCLEVMSEPTPSTETEEGMPKHIKIANFYNWHNISEAIQKELEKQNKQTLKISCSNYPSFDVEVNKENYNSYPYMDSFQWFNTYDNRLTADEENSSDVLKLDCTSGGYSNTSRCECEHCGYEVHSEDDLMYVDTADASVCEDCATYCDERDEYILTDDAIYNNYTGQYHYSNDLEM